MLYTLTAQDVATEAVADDTKAMLAIYAGTTAGHRGRLLKLDIGPSNDSAQDLNFAVRVARYDRTGDGTAAATVISANLGKVDPHSRDSIMTGGRDYSVDPSAFETEDLWAAEFNARGGLLQVWDRDEAPSWGDRTTGNGQGLAVLMTPRAATAGRFTITATWEEY